MDLYRSEDPMDRSPSVGLRLAVLEPIVSKLDPSAMLPPEIAPYAVGMRGFWKANREKAQMQRVQIGSPAQGGH